MATLASVNETLLSQNEILKDTQQSVARSNNLLLKTLDQQMKAANMARLKDLEANREGGRFKAVAGGIGTAGSAISGAASRAGSGLQGLLGNIGSFLTPAALAALPGILAGTLLRRGIPALAVGVFSDEIADFLLGPDANREMRDQVSKAIQFGAAGSLLGKRFALIGAAAGFLIDDEVAKQLTEVGKSFGAMLGMDIKNLDDLKSVMMSIGTFLRENLKSGLEGINLLLNGEIAKFFGIGEGESKVGGTLMTLAALGAIFAGPGAVVKGGLLFAINAAKVLWGGAKLLSAITGLTALGNSLVGAAPAAGAAAARSGGGMLLKVAGGVLRFAGPLGAIIGIATLGYAVGEWFKTTDMYKQLAAEQDVREQESQAFQGALQQRIDAGMDPEQAKAEVQALQIARTDGGFGQRYGQETVREYKGEVVGSQNFMQKLNQLEKLEPILIQQGNAAKLKELEERRAALRALEESKKPVMAAPAPTSGVSIRNETMPNNAPPGQPMIVDGSTNTTNNIGNSNTTLSAPPPSAGQNDDYSNALGSRGSLNLSTSGYLN